MSDSNSCEIQSSAYNLGNLDAENNTCETIIVVRPDHICNSSDSIDLQPSQSLNKSDETIVPEATILVSLEERPCSGHQGSASALTSEDTAMSAGQHETKNDDKLMPKKSLEEKTRVDVVKVEEETLSILDAIPGGRENYDKGRSFEACWSSSNSPLNFTCQGITGGNVGTTRSRNLTCSSEEDGLNDDASRQQKVLKDDRKVNLVKEEENRDSSIRIGDAEYSDKVCRICHLTSDQTRETDLETAKDLVELGCDCKGELRMAHSHCAEAWFKLKGNRVCEICGVTAKNVIGLVDHRFMVEWNEHRLSGEEAHNSSWRHRRCPQGQPICNFLMALLVISFVLPWFLHINMF